MSSFIIDGIKNICIMVVFSSSVVISLKVRYFIIIRLENMNVFVMMVIISVVVVMMCLVVVVLIWIVFWVDMLCFCVLIIWDIKNIL